MSRLLKIGVSAIVLVLLVGLVVQLITKARINSDKVGCQNHLRELGLNGVRHASVPGVALPAKPKDELPPGTYPHTALVVDQRLSWYLYTLNVLDQGVQTASPQTKQMQARGLGALAKNSDIKSAWDEGANAELARFKLSTAICPAQVPTFEAGQWMPTHYVALGGLGLDTPTKDWPTVPTLAGAYRYDGSTPDSAIKDGLGQTAQIMETTSAIGPWLQGGPNTLRALDPEATPYLGRGRPFGGCHPGGAYVSFVDGSVQFVRESINPVVFRSLLTIAGGPAELNFDSP